MQNILLSCFFRCVNLSIRASWLILAVIILRAAIKTILKRVNGILWLFAGIRLILPFSFVSVFRYRKFDDRAGGQLAGK